MNHLLLIEDEENVRVPLVKYLESEGFTVTAVSRLSEADAAVDSYEQAAAKYGAILLDWMLPDGQGIELLKRWRMQRLQIPVILLTARTELIDRVLGLELGANDYILKPFEPRELVARIRVQLRLNKNESPPPSASSHRSHLEDRLESSEIRCIPATREAFFQGKPLELTKTEFDLLRLFLENPNQVFSREELLKKVWGYDRYPSTRTVDTHLLQLRQKTRAELFETLHGIGYRFRPEPRR